MPVHMQDHLTIPARFRGPPSSGNGGYVAGAFAELLTPADHTATEVTLRAPIPLDQPLRVVRSDKPGNAPVTIYSDSTLIAEVRPQAFTLEIPQPPTFQQALAVQPQAIPLQPRQDSPMPGALGLHPICFCCGANHDTGLKVYAAPVDDQQVAAAWTTRQEWADQQGYLPAELIWTALDCPGQLAFFHQGQRTGLLGRITATIHGKARAGDDLIVTAWPIRVDGKKHFAGSAVFNLQGELLAEAVAVWIGRLPFSTTEQEMNPTTAAARKQS